MHQGDQPAAVPAAADLPGPGARLSGNGPDPIPVLELLIKYSGPTGLRAAGRSNVLRWARNHSRKDPANLIDAIFTALGEQTVTVAGTEAVELVIPRVAAQIKELKHQRTIVADEVEKLLDDFPLSQVLMSMPGVGIKTAATILLTIGDASSFNTAGHLAAYAGIAPVTRRSGTSIRGEFPARSGNKQLKNALFRSAWIATCHHPALEGLLPKETRPRKETQRRRHLPRPPPLRRNLRHAQKRHPLPGKDSPRPLDQKHGTPPTFHHRLDRVAAKDQPAAGLSPFKRHFPAYGTQKGHAAEFFRAGVGPPARIGRASRRKDAKTLHFPPPIPTPCKCWEERG